MCTIGLRIHAYSGQCLRPARTYLIKISARHICCALLTKHSTSATYQLSNTSSSHMKIGITKQRHVFDMIRPLDSTAIALVVDNKKHSHAHCIHIQMPMFRMRYRYHFSSCLRIFRPKFIYSNNIDSNTLFNIWLRRRVTRLPIAFYRNFDTYSASHCANATVPHTWIFFPENETKQKQLAKLLVGFESCARSSFARSGHTMLSDYIWNLFNGAESRIGFALSQ